MSNKSLKNWIATHPQTEFDSSTSITSLKEEYGIKLDRNFSMVCTPNCFNEPDISKRGLNVFALDVLELASEIQLPRADSNQRPYLKYAYTYTCSFGNSSVKEILNDNYSIEGYLVNECNIEVTLQTIKSRLK